MTRLLAWLVLAFLLVVAGSPAPRAGHAEEPPTAEAEQLPSGG